MTMNICAGMGKRRKSIGKNSGPVLNLFSPQHDLFNSHCHSDSLLFVQGIRLRYRVVDSIPDLFARQIVALD